jgi:hypothetical protein
VHFVSDFNEITPSKLLKNKIKVKEKFCVVLVSNSIVEKFLVLHKFECKCAVEGKMETTATVKQEPGVETTNGAPSAPSTTSAPNPPHPLSSRSKRILFK